MNGTEFRLPLNIANQLSRDGRYVAINKPEMRIIANYWIYGVLPPLTGAQA